MLYQFNKYLLQIAEVRNKALVIWERSKKQEWINIQKKG